MEIVEYLAVTLFVIWCVSEIAISLVSLRNRLRGLSSGSDRFSFFIVWVCTVPPIWFALLIHVGLIFVNGFGSFSALFPLLGYVGCFMLALGIIIRIIAVATLNRQFTTQVVILDKHQIVTKGMYRIIRHPAYLGYLVSLVGMGLISGNWLSLSALVVLPLVGIVYRIHVEESVLLQHFGAMYQEYKRQTNRLLPGIW